MEGVRTVGKRFRRIIVYLHEQTIHARRYGGAREM